ncbi:MAG: hypothetical protein K8F33_03670 [Thermomonas sp.]|uniref:hypothetical protein n=1 Tax=Thermomonas sp. TaxID=1971895 RepID=UPI001DC451CA|nr:hypothetical protein [Thermomonas sp.]MBZ0087183.1 hypothetical protein [Thermomonas sp.]
MDMESRLSQEWNSLPPWVKSEVLQAPKHYAFYKWYISRLAEHSENMKAVWRLFDKHRGAFRRNTPLRSLLCVLHQAVLGPDPGQPRSDDDRRAIADAIQKHVDGLERQIGRLGTGAVFGLYPVEIASEMAVAAWKKAEAKVARPFQTAAGQMLAVLDSAGISAEVRAFVIGQLTSLQYEIEHELEVIHTDPRESLRTLATSAQEWADTCGWCRDDIIWHIGSSIRDWFGRNHYSETATLTTAITGNEVSEDVVAGVMRRRQRSLSLRKVKVEIGNSPRESDRD